ncbi:MAG: hypothetical protein M3O88_06210 [Actinomycetota bacterium]|nr:hypothetical protein [Actinomycetota bacterium]
METELETRWDHAEVFREISPRLWSAIYAYSGGARSLTDDVVAEAFARALEHDSQIREPEAWLFRTAFRLAGSELRRRRRDVALVESSAHVDSSTLEVLLAMRKLSPGQRACVFLHLPGRSPGPNDRPHHRHVASDGEGTAPSGPGTIAASARRQGGRR